MPACKWRSSAIFTYPNVRCVPVLENRHFRLRPDLNLNTPYNEFGGHGIATTISPVNALPLRFLRRWRLSLLVQVRDPGRRPLSRPPTSPAAALRHPPAARSSPESQIVGVSAPSALTSSRGIFELSTLGGLHTDKPRRCRGARRPNCHLPFVVKMSNRRARAGDRGG